MRTLHPINKTATIAFACCSLAMLAISCAYEPTHATLELSINSKKDGHIVTFEPNLELEGDYLWEFGDGTTSNLDQPVHVYEEMGIYEIVLNLVNGNSFFHATTTVIINGIEDIEGNVYSTARAGDQIWMTENLMATSCLDGTPLDTAHYRLEENGEVRYNYLAIEQCDICPQGWELPTVQTIYGLTKTEKTTEELENLLNITQEKFGGFSTYMMFQDGSRLWHGDLGSYIDRGVAAVTSKGGKDDYSVVRCIKAL